LKVGHILHGDGLVRLHTSKGRNIRPRIVEILVRESSCANWVLVGVRPTSSRKEPNNLSQTMNMPPKFLCTLCEMHHGQDPFSLPILVS